MSSKSTEWNDWLIEKLGKELATFDNETSSLLLDQDSAFKLYCDLLGEDAESLAKRSSSRRSVRLRARELLADVFRSLGPEVFLLFTLAVSISKLSEIAPQTRLPKIRSWWETAPHPLGLAVVAKELCETNSISTLISSSQKNRFSQVTIATEQGRSQSTHPPLSETHSLASGPQPHGTDPDARSTSSRKHPLLDVNLSTEEHSTLIEDAQLTERHSKAPLSQDANQTLEGDLSRKESALSSDNQKKKDTSPESPSSATVPAHRQVTDEPSLKRPRLESQQIPGYPILPGEGQYLSFSFMRHHMIENLPEPFRAGIKTSNLWRKEKERGGLAVTNCLSVYMPETPKEDALFVVRIGYDDGWNISNLFGLGDPDTPEF